jgi:hypothetical protein
VIVYGIIVPANQQTSGFGRRGFRSPGIERFAGTDQHVWVVNFERRIHTCNDFLVIGKRFVEARHFN